MLPEKGLTYISYSLFERPLRFALTLLKTGSFWFQSYLFDLLEFGYPFPWEYLTVFALDDAATTYAGDGLKKDAVLYQHIIKNFAGYTTDLVPGKAYRTAAGGHVMISIKDGDFFVNDVKIVRPNVLAQRGVVHYVEKVSFFFPLSCCSGLGHKWLGEKAKSLLGHWPLQRPAPV